MGKTNPGRFFEDYTYGEKIVHAIPRTVSPGMRDLYTALYPSRFALYSSDEFARACGLAASPIEDLAAFHLVFGKTVPDISLNAVANLGYGQGRFLMPVWPGDTLSAQSDVIGLKENSNGKTGIVWVHTRGFNQHRDIVLEYYRWVMVKKRNPDAPAPEAAVPHFAPALRADELVVPEGLSFAQYDLRAAGEPHCAADYAVGEVIDHVDGVTLSEAEHMMATRLWQNTAKVHFDATARNDGRRLIYGGHVISMARALSFNGLANAQMVVAINAGTHANPCFADDTICAWSEVLDKAETEAPGVAALRLRLVATRGHQPAGALRDGDGKYLPDVLLDLDYWVLMPA